MPVNILSDQSLVPPLLEPHRFSIAAHRAFFAGWEYSHRLIRRDCIRPEFLTEMRNETTVAETMFADGPVRWQRVRAEFAGWYSKESTNDDLSVAEHRLWAAFCLQDLRDDPDVKIWLLPENPLHVTPPLLIAAAQAQLHLFHISPDDPADSRSAFDLPDLLARTRAAHADALADKRADFFRK